MPYNFPEIKRFKGLFLQANSFDLPDGSLEECNNAVISKDGIISKIRGNYNYFNGSTNTLKDLAYYKGTLFGICSDKVLSFADTGVAPNQTGSPTTLTGATVAVTGTRQSRTLEQNNNLYMTSDNGVLKIENTAGPVRRAGTPPALDLDGTLLPVNGSLLGDNQYGWRVVFGRTDANQNLLLGAPSDFLFMTNLKLLACTWVRNSAVLVTVTTAGGALHNLTSAMVATITNGSVTSLNGDRTVTVTSPTTFTFVPGSDPVTASGTLDFYTSRNARLQFSIPAEITDISDQYFYQVYRTSASGSSSASPYLDFALIDQVTLTAADLTARFIVYDDSVLAISRGAELYTNPGSREGEAQQNNQPPICEDSCLFKNHIFYGAATIRSSLDLQLIDHTKITAGSSYFSIKIGTTTRNYRARGVVGNRRVSATGSGTGTITITYTSHGLVNNDWVYISNVTGTLPAGLYQITYIGANSFSVTAATKTATALDFFGVKDSAGDYLFYVSASSSVGVARRETSVALVKAINMDPNILIYANYASTNVGIPGMMKLTAINFGATFSLSANDATSGASMYPTLPSSFLSGTQVTSVSDPKDSGFYSSKIGEGEAVPLANYFPVGSSNKKLLRLIALRDSVLAIKEDGIWRIDGDAVTNFSATSLDSTTICLAPNSVESINNQVIFLSNQGVCLATSNAVRIVSRDIETPIKAVLGSSVLSAQTTGVAYESERLYFLTTIKPGSTVADQTWVYNTLSDGWSSCDHRILSGRVGPNDTMFWIDRSNVVRKERKNFDRTDFCGQNYSVTVNAVSVDLKTVQVTSTVAPEIGDVLILNSIVNRIKAVRNDSTNLYSLTLRVPTSLAANDTPVLYSGYNTTIKTSPFHAGAIGRAKQFAQMQLHLRDNSVHNVDITFGGQSYGSSPTVNWTSEPVDTSPGWGLAPWGMFGWGQSDTTAITYKTEQAPVVRVYIPLIAQRSTFIQPIIDHPNAAEEINLQAMTFAVRGYNERVTK